MVQIEFIGSDTPSEDEQRNREQTKRLIDEELEELNGVVCSCGKFDALVEVDAHYVALGYHFEIATCCCSDFRARLESVLLWQPLERMLHLGVERLALTMADGYME